MVESQRVDIRGILADSNLRRELMVTTLQATQAREGIETTREQAEHAYQVVTEAERAAFFDLAQFWPRGIKANSDRRHEMFVRDLRDGVEGVRFDVARRDFATLSGAPLVYAQVGLFAALFREHSALGEAWAYVRGGMNSTESERFVRHRWEPAQSSRRKWVAFSKGGDFVRFYSDLDLVFDWTDNGAEFRRIVRERYGSESRFVKSPEFYFKRGITWTEKSYTGFSARVLPKGAIFNVAGPAAIPRDYANEWFLLGVLNSSLLSYVAWVLCGRSHGATYITALPIARPTAELHGRISGLVRASHDAKAFWDTGNEISTNFQQPWLLRDVSSPNASIPSRLDQLVEDEAIEEQDLRDRYGELDEQIYKLYGVPSDTRDLIRDALSNRPPEVLWPDMESRTVEQRRTEHVLRLLSYVVSRVVEADEDGIVPFVSLAGEPSLLERVTEELQALFDREAGQVEIEITNELKKGAKGYRRCSSISEWLANAFFEYHCGLYKSRPIIWHISSTQGTTPFAFGALVDYHRFDRNRIGKLRGQHLRDAIETFRREAALADKAGRTDERVEWQSRLEETQELDRRLQLIQEGRSDGQEGGERDFRILTPWKSPAQRPKGWDPDFDDGVKVNIGPFQKSGTLRVPKVV